MYRFPPRCSVPPLRDQRSIRLGSWSASRIRRPARDRTQRPALSRTKPCKTIMPRELLLSYPFLSTSASHVGLAARMFVNTRMRIRGVQTREDQILRTRDEPLGSGGE